MVRGLAWSTSELARLSGTTVKTVRHYHQRGLLDEPERASNGYKQYGPEHLVRILQVRRLSELGLTLEQVGDLTAGHPAPDTGTDQAETLRTLDRELEANIVRQQQMREDIAAILDHGSALDLPSGFGQVKGELTEADRGLLLIYSQVLDPTTMESMRAMLTEMNHTTESEEFRTLSAEAGDEVRADLARRYAPQVKRLHMKYGWENHLGDIPHRQRQQVDQTLGLAVVRLYNEAQVDVLVRIEEILSDSP